MAITTVHSVCLMFHWALAMHSNHLNFRNIIHLDYASQITRQTSSRLYSLAGPLCCNLTLIFTWHETFWLPNYPIIQTLLQKLTTDHLTVILICIFSDSWFIEVEDVCMCACVLHCTSSPHEHWPTVTIISVTTTELVWKIRFWIHRSTHKPKEEEHERHMMALYGVTKLECNCVLQTLSSKGEKQALFATFKIKRHAKDYRRLFVF